MAYQLYDYHFIGDSKTWCEAQAYCRKTHTDLATVSNMTDVERLRRPAESTEEAWIGLYNEPDGDRTWHWSLPGVEFNETKWAHGEPNDRRAPENCVRTVSNQWADVTCTQRHFFICYNEGDPSQHFHVIRDEKTWLQAQSYCRDHHTDLVSGATQLENMDLETEAAAVTLWIGLFRDTWRWSGGSSFSFRRWYLDFDTQQNNKQCAALDEGGRWKNLNCDERKPFFCYDNKVILIKENKTWEEALYYCRDNHYDLVSVTNLDEQRWVQDGAEEADTAFVWTGLRYTCTLGFWFWVSNEAVVYENWASGGKIDECDTSGAMDTRGRHEWSGQPDDRKFNFICSKN